MGWLWSIIFDQHRNKKSGSKKFKQQRWTLSMYKKTEKSDEKEARTKKNRVALQAARQPFGRSINVSQENVRRTERYVSSSNFVPRRLQHIGAVAVATLSLEGCGLPVQLFSWLPSWRLNEFPATLVAGGCPTSVLLPVRFFFLFQASFQLALNATAKLRGYSRLC